MDVVWSPRKRIKLSVNSTKSSSNAHKSTVTQHSAVSNAKPAVPENSTRQSRARDSRRRSLSNFDKELDECFDTKENAFNLTQVFLVDPETELAMLRADIEVASSLTPLGQEPLMPTIGQSSHRAASNVSESSRCLGRWDTAPSRSSSIVIEEDISQIKRVISDPAGASTRQSFASTSSCLMTQSVLVDELEGVDINELTAVVDSAESAYITNTYTDFSSPIPKCMFSSRCEILQIPIHSATGSVGMRVKELPSHTERYITLEGVWRDSFLSEPWQLEPGDFVHILASPSKTWSMDNHITVGDSASLFPDIIVFHPDTVLSSTTLSACATCYRRSVIQNRVLAPDIGARPTDASAIARALSPVVGNVVHEALQRSAVVGDFSIENILRQGTEAMESMLSSVWMSGGRPHDVIQQLHARVKYMSDFGLTTWPKKIKILRACEAEIRPKSLGVTGKLDMDVEDWDGNRSCVEIKTGKHHAIHVGQVVLYYLLQYVDKFERKAKTETQNILLDGVVDVSQEDTLPPDVASLYYLLYLPPDAAAEMINVSISPRECQNVMAARNAIASHTAKNSLPDPIYKKGDCQFCPVRRECAAYQLVKDEQDVSDRKKFYDSLQLKERRNLSPEYKTTVTEYMRTWLSWIDAQNLSERASLSAVRRYRGNLLNMVMHSLAREAGDIEEVEILDWLPLLVKGRETMARFCDVVEFMREPAPSIACINMSENAWTHAKIATEIIVSTISSGKSILLCGSSHESVDQVLSEVMDDQASSDLLDRITRLASRPEDVAETNRTLLPHDKWENNIEQFVNSRLMFACTVKAVHHDLLSLGGFEVTLVLGSQEVKDPSLWGVLLRSKRVILIEN